MSALAVIEPTTPVVPMRAKVTRYGLEIEPGLTREEFSESVITPLRTLVGYMEESGLWWWGDALAYAEKNYGETYREALEKSGYSYTTLAHAKRVCERIEFGRRIPNLTFRHHHDVAMMLEDKKDQDEWLHKAEKEGWKTNQLRTEIRTHKGIYNKKDDKNADAGQFEACEWAKNLKTFFATQDISKWTRKQCEYWHSDLEPMVEAYNKIQARLAA
jgi:hypothetical protein